MQIAHWTRSWQAEIYQNIRSLNVCFCEGLGESGSPDPKSTTVPQYRDIKYCHYAVSGLCQFWPTEIERERETCWSADVVADDLNPCNPLLLHCACETVTARRILYNMRWDHTFCVSTCLQCETLDGLHYSGRNKLHRAWSCIVFMPQDQDNSRSSRFIVLMRCNQGQFKWSLLTNQDESWDGLRFLFLKDFINTPRFVIEQANVGQVGTWVPRWSCKPWTSSTTSTIAMCFGGQRPVTFSRTPGKHLGYLDCKALFFFQMFSLGGMIQKKGYQFFEVQ